MLKKILRSCLLVGLSMFTITTVLGRVITIEDFAKGFFEGMSAVFIVVGVSYYIWCFFGKKKPSKPE